MNQEIVCTERKKKRRVNILGVWSELALQAMQGNCPLRWKPLEYSQRRLQMAEQDIHRLCEVVNGVAVVFGMYQIGTDLYRSAII